MGSCFEYRIDERDTCHDQTRKENESRTTAIAEIFTLWMELFCFLWIPQRGRLVLYAIIPMLTCQIEKRFLEKKAFIV